MRPGFACILLIYSLTVLAQEPDLVLDEVPVPDENPVTESKRILGKILFWEEQLSTDSSVACGTCHKPGFGGADDRASRNAGTDLVFNTGNDTFGSPGIPLYAADLKPRKDSLYGYAPQVTRRAAQSVLTAMYPDVLFWDGRALEQLVDPLTGDIVMESGAALESQSLVPIISPTEMGHINRTWEEVTAKLVQVKPLALASDLPDDIANALQGGKNYSELFTEAFGDMKITPVRIAMAIATYERSLVPDQSPFDEYVQGNASAMTEDQVAGWELFRDSVCTRCHVPPLFTNNGFARTGLRTRFDDNGLQVVTKNTDDFGLFKIPSLRNVGLRKHLTHVGWITGVQDAIDFYNSGTHETGHTIFTDGLSTIEDPDNPGSTIRIDQIDFFGDKPDKQALVVDFLSNALTDPRAAGESFPFDRPRLGSEQRVAAAVSSDGEGVDSRVATRVIANGELNLGAKFARQDRLSINQSIAIAPEDRGKAGQLFLVVVYAGRYFLRDGEGRFKPWSRKIQNLEPVMEKEALTPTEQVSVVETLSGLAGDFTVYTGYSTGDRIIYSGAPLRFSVE